jgi:protease-4
MGDYAASGGYYISMAGDYIFAQPNTITGSIGVFGGKMNLAGLYNKMGLTLHTYQRGNFANLFSSTSDFSDAERSKYQEFLSGFYDIFITKAADGRNLQKEDVHQVAQGRVWTGEQALERKLVDELGGLDAAIKKAAELAKIDTYNTMQIPQHLSFFEELLKELGESGHESRAQTAASVELQLLPTDVLRHVSTLSQLEEILHTDGRATLLPMQIEVR